MASRVQGSLEKSKFFVKIHDAYNNVDIILYKLKKDRTDALSCGRHADQLKDTPPFIHMPH
jgi:aconitase B